MDKYIYVCPPDRIDKEWASWWVPQKMLKIINYLEEANPSYEYYDIITNGNGNFKVFVIMKLKDTFKNNLLNH